MQTDKVWPQEIGALGTFDVGAMSYAGQFNIMAVADKDTYPDLGVFAASAKDELRALAASTPIKPGTPRAVLTTFGRQCLPRCHAV